MASQMRRRAASAPCRVRRARRVLDMSKSDEPCERYLGPPQSSRSWPQPCLLLSGRQPLGSWTTPAFKFRSVKVKNTFIEVAFMSGEEDEEEEDEEEEEKPPRVSPKRFVMPNSDNFRSGLSLQPTSNIVHMASASGAERSPATDMELHAQGLCRPCAWFWRPQSCLHGDACDHCHLCSEQEIKDRKKAKKNGFSVPEKRRFRLKMREDHVAAFPSLPIRHEWQQRFKQT
mmetsp:Transcript_45825/g.82650  ORF Transcript_45825/g.82650 Transcript_45825/m.82650 type:complete len:230 (-) Transcript_45825:73-762(-)